MNRPTPYIPIKPRAGLYLFNSGDDPDAGQFIASTFAAAWDRLPLAVRRRLLKYWRETKPALCWDDGSPTEELREPWPPIVLEADEHPFDKGNATKAGARAMAGFHPLTGEISFTPEAAKATRAQLDSTIAHELAHAYLNATGADCPEARAYNAKGFSQSEYDADALADSWGFYQPKPWGQLARRRKAGRKAAK